MARRSRDGGMIYQTANCLRHTSSASQARHLLLKEKAILTVSNVFSAGEHSSPLTVFNLHNCFACGTPRTSSPTIELQICDYKIDTILVFESAKQSSVAPRQLLLGYLMRELPKELMEFLLKFNREPLRHG